MGVQSTRCGRRLKRHVAAIGVAALKVNVEVNSRGGG
jgi:hypothetical protein